MAVGRRVRPISYVLPDQIVPTTSSTQLGPDRWRRFARQFTRNKINYGKLNADETRLVTLKRCRSPEDPVEIKLIENVRFDQMPKFEALSYHWGVEGSLEPVFLIEDDADVDEEYHALQTPSDDFPRTQIGALDADRDRVAQKFGKMAAQRHYFPKKNLYNALSRLRSPTEDITIWIDAICIDQSDNKDRSRQVERMSDIYSAAETVVIWLGDSNDRTDNAVDFVANLIREPEKIKFYVEDDNFTASWQNLLQLMRSSWFSRRWVIQELALADDAVVFCGSKQIHWTDLQDAISIFTENFDIIRERFRRSAQEDYNALSEIEPLHAKKLVDNITGIFRRHPHRSDRRLEPLLGLEYLVSSLAILDAADPRDTINAFRNISRETFQKRDNGPQKHGYTKNLLEVYLSFVKWVVDDTQCLDIICRRWAIPEKTEVDGSGNYYEPVVLPTWIQVVDADDRSNAVPGQRRHGDPFVSLPGERAYKACYNLKADVKFGCDHVEELPDQPRPTTPALVVSSPSSSVGALPALDTQPPSGAAHSDDGQSMSNVQPDSPNNEARDASSNSPEGFPAQDTQQAQAVSGAPSPVDGKTTNNLQANVPNGATMDPALARTANLAVSAFQSGIRRPQNTVGTFTRRPNLLDPSHSLHIRPHNIRRVSLSSDVPGSPPSIHIPALHSKEVLAQLVEKQLDASLFAKGIVIGPVRRISVMTDGVIGHGVFFELYGNKEKIERGKPVPDEVWRTLVAERGPNNTVPPALYARACRYAMRSLNTNKDLNIKELREKSTADFMKPFLKRVEAVIWNRCFFRVENHRSPGMAFRGFGPYTAQDGDVLCILYGCNVPCILRPFDNTKIGRYYSMVGEAYVYGIMDGDYIKDLGEDEVRERTEEFRIL